MATDIIPETESQPQAQHVQQHSDRQISRKGRRWGRVLFVIGVVAVAAAAAVLIPRAFSSPDTGPKLTHTITRGDLLVTVSEQGRLESSVNDEILCGVRGRNTVIWVIESGSVVQKGDVLVRLDSKFIEQQVSERSKYAHWSRSSAEPIRGMCRFAQTNVPNLACTTWPRFWNSWPPWRARRFWTLCFSRER